MKNKELEALTSLKRWRNIIDDKYTAQVLKYSSLGEVLYPHLNVIESALLQEYRTSIGCCCDQCEENEKCTACNTLGE